MTRKKVFSESSHRIETHLDVIVEVLEVQSGVSFELCIDEEFIDCPLSNGGALVLAGTTVVGSRYFGKYFCVVEYFKLLI